LLPGLKDFIKREVNHRDGQHFRQNFDTGQFFHFRYPFLVKYFGVNGSQKIQIWIYPLNETARTFLVLGNSDI